MERDTGQTLWHLAVSYAAPCVMCVHKCLLLMITRNNTRGWKYTLLKSPKQFTICITALTTVALTFYPLHSVCTYRPLLYCLFNRGEWQRTREKVSVFPRWTYRHVPHYCKELAGPPNSLLFWSSKPLCAQLCLAEWLVQEGVSNGSTA
jgi:hypothetical protein